MTYLEKFEIFFMYAAESAFFKSTINKIVSIKKLST
jgi:hypothetical protein